MDNLENIIENYKSYKKQNNIDFYYDENKIKEYINSAKKELQKLKELTKKYKLYDDNYESFVEKMCILSEVGDKIESTDLKKKFANEFLDMHNSFEKIEQENILKDVYVWDYLQ